MHRENKQKTRLQTRLEMIREASARLTCASCLLLLLGLAMEAMSADVLPEGLNGRTVNCANPRLGERSSRDNANCYQTELTQAVRELRDLHREIYGKASFEERRRLRELETLWRKLRDTQCALVSGLEPDITFSLSIDKFCQAVLTRARIDEVRRLNHPILERAHAPDAPGAKPGQSPNPDGLNLVE